MPQYFEDNPSVGECRAVLTDKSISLNCKNQSAINNTYDVQPEDNDKLSQQLRNEEIEIVSPETHPEYFVPVAPDGGWSWIVLLATFLNFFLIDGIFFSVGLLMFEWADHFEASKTKVSLVGSLMLGCYQMIGPFAAALTNKFGCRKVALFGCALASVSIFVSSLMPTVNALIITFGILAGSSFGLIYLPSLIAVSFYFNRRRELASGIAVAGTPFGAVIFGPLAGYLIQLYGWSCTLIFFSAFILHGIIFSCLYRPLKPIHKLEVLDLSKETNESIVNLVDEIQSNLMIASNTFIKSNQFINSSNRIGQNLYILDEGNEENEQQQQQRKNSVNIEAGEKKQSICEKLHKLNPCEEDVQKCTDEKKEAITEKPKSSELSTVDGQTISKQVNKSLVDSNSLINSSSSSAHQRSSLVPNTVKLPSMSNDRIISTQEKQLSSEPVSEKRMNTSDQRQDLTADQSIIRSGYKLSSKLTNFLKRELDPTSYVLSSPCLSVNNPAYDGQTSNEANKFLLDVYNRRTINPLRNKKLLHPTNTIVSRRRHLSHNLTPSIPTIVEDQELTKSNGNNQFHFGQDFSSAITVANLGRDKRRISMDRNLINSGLIHSSIASALTTYHPQKIEFCKIDSKPVLVALPHESISIEDYSRPLYRSDIFFRGNPMPQIPNEYYSTINKMKSTGDVDRKMQNKLNDIYRMTNSCLTVPLNDTIDHSHVDGSYGTLSDGDEHESGFCKSQSNWIESMIVSLTSIPLPNDDNRGLLLPSTKQSLNEKLPKSFPDYDSRIHDESGGDSNICHEIYADDVDHGDADNADHVNVMDDICLCGFCLTGIRRLRDRRLCSSLFYSQKLSDCCSCFHVEQKQIYKRVNKEFPNQYEADIMDELNINDYNDLNKVTRYTRFIQCCKCVSLKPILDVLGTMLDLSLLFKPKYLILWISNLIGILGMYVPLIYVSDFASVYGISTKLSSYFLSIMGVSSIIGRLLVAWLSSLSSVSPLILQSITQFSLGLLVCLMPVFTTFVGMATLFGFYGFLSGVFSTLSTIILYDLVGMDELTTAVGLITLSRGISSVLGAPLAGLLYEATNSFRVPYIAAGLTIIISAVLFLLILCYDWIVYLFTPVKFKRNNTETCSLE
ncbi:unnamed protein product [Schistosoma rodhaini]|uniref:Major facilitator superfamily (MFS) profile domain-containing protein n=1 Tax=Schistosoma rodhaini TaxID=6188 RepID=A0AA85F6Q2_9TREM|nr:unnamed protein product [Schistosoma rodhaini]